MVIEMMRVDDENYDESDDGGDESDESDYESDDGGDENDDE